MKKTFTALVAGTITLMSICYAIGQTVNPRPVETTSVDVNAETNSVTTGMNGNTSTNSGIPISSTSSSAESRKTSGVGG